jgi:hypothetical protein
MKNTDTISMQLIQKKQANMPQKYLAATPNTRGSHSILDDTVANEEASILITSLAPTKAQARCSMATPRE